MAIYTQYGNKVTIIRVKTEAKEIHDIEFGTEVTVRRGVDGAVRVYRMCELKADGGIEEVVNEVWKVVTETHS